MADQEIYLIIDGSGSMSGVKDDVAKGLNEFIKEQQDDALSTGDDVVLSITAFDGNVREVLFEEQIDLVQPIKAKDVYFGGNTALYDALGRTLTKAQAEKSSASKLVVVYTDGFENASREFIADDIKKLVEELTNDGWSFVYLGAELADFANERTTVLYSSAINTSKANVNQTWNKMSQTSTLLRGMGDKERYDATVQDGGVIAYAAAAGAVDWDEELERPENKVKPTTPDKK